nr:ABC transporter substrate-binding protein [Maliibacterium massiliense]
MKTRKLLTLALVLVLSLSMALVGCDAPPEASQSPSASASASQSAQGSAGAGKLDPSKAPVEVSFVATLTGTNATIGDQIVKGAEMARQEINDAGGINGAELKFNVIDDQQTADQALTAVKKAVDQNKAQIIMGPDSSNLVLAGLPYAAQNKVPLIVSGTNAKVTGQGYKTVWRVRPNDDTTALNMIDAVKDYDKVGYFYTNEDYGLGFLNTMEPAYKQSGKEFVLKETCNIGDTDFSSQITKLKNANLDALIVVAKEVEGAKFLRQAHELGLDVPMYAGSSMGGDMVLELAGADALEGLTILTPFVPTDPDPDLQTFVKKFKDAHGVEPLNHAVAYYDMTYLVAKVLSEYGTTKEQIAEGFSKVEYEGLLATYKSDEKGDMVFTQSLAQFKNGVWEYVGPVG